MKATITIDGEPVSKTRATVSVFDHGLLYGDGIFEGIRVRERRVFRLDDHLRRLETSAAGIGLEIPGGIERVRDVVLGTVRAHGDDEAYVRLVITRGEGPLGVDPFSCEHPRVICIVSAIALYDAAKRAAGLDLITSSWRHPSPDVLDPRVKSLNYLNNVVAKREAKLRGADEALLLNARGTIAETAVANLFVVQSGRLLTPPVWDGALEGITRASVLEVAADLGISTEERTLTRTDVLSADEAFLSGSGAGLVGIRSLDGSLLRGTERRVLAALEAAWPAHARERGVAFDVREARAG